MKFRSESVAEFVAACRGDCRAQKTSDFSPVAAVADHRLELDEMQTTEMRGRLLGIGETIVCHPATSRDAATRLTIIRT